MKRLFLYLFFSLFLVCGFTCIGSAQDTSIVGKWKTIDDDTGKPKSIVEITERDGKYYGKIIDLFRGPDEDPNPVCSDCPEDDPRYNQPVRGMEIVKDMKKSNDQYSGGTILDPAKGAGKTYTCKMWREGENLMVRGYIAFFFRTQTWLPVK